MTPTLVVLRCFSEVYTYSAIVSYHGYTSLRFEETCTRPLLDWAEVPLDSKGTIGMVTMMKYAKNNVVLDSVTRKPRLKVFPTVAALGVEVKSFAQNCNFQDPGKLICR